VARGEHFLKDGTPLDEWRNSIKVKNPLKKEEMEETATAGPKELLGFFERQREEERKKGELMRQRNGPTPEN